MKLISWNVNGLRACVGKGFFEFLEGRRGLLKILLHCRWQFRLPGDFFKISG